MRRVTSYAGEGFKLPDTCRKSAAMYLHNSYGKFLKTQCATVVTHSFPGFDDIRGPRPGEFFQGGKSLEKQGVFRQNSRDLSLLQHDFGNEDPIWIVFSSPRQLTAVFPVPAKDSGIEKRSVLRGDIQSSSLAQRKMLSSSLETNDSFPSRISIDRSSASVTHRISSNALFTGLPVNRRTKQYVSSKTPPSS